MKGLISGFLAASSAGLSLDLIKILLFYTNITEFELIYQRSFVAFIIVTVIIYYNNLSPFDLDRNVAKFAFGRVIGSSFGFMFEVFALEFIPVSKAVLIINNPILTSIISFVLIGERSSKHDIISFVICTIGVIFLTDPFSESITDFNHVVGLVIAFLSSLSFNLSYVALRYIKDRPVNSWLLVFYIMATNLIIMPSCFLSIDVYKETFTNYNDKVYILILLIGLLTLSTLYFTHLTF